MPTFVTVKGTSREIPELWFIFGGLSAFIK
jgi:hypothetical protein